MVLLEVSLVSQIASERVVTVFLGLEADIGARSGMRHFRTFLREHRMLECNWKCAAKLKEMPDDKCDRGIVHC